MVSSLLGLQGPLRASEFRVQGSRRPGVSQELFGRIFSGSLGASKRSSHFLKPRHRHPADPVFHLLQALLQAWQRCRALKSRPLTTPCGPRPCPMSSADSAVLAVFLRSDLCRPRSSLALSAQNSWSASAPGMAEPLITRIPHPRRLRFLYQCIHAP